VETSKGNENCFEKLRVHDIRDTNRAEQVQGKGFQFELKITYIERCVRLSRVLSTLKVEFRLRYKTFICSVIRAKGT